MEYLSAKAILDIAAEKFVGGEIEYLCVIAPFGRHRRWVDFAIPQHLNSAIPVTTQIWKSRREFDLALTRHPVDHTLRVLAVPTFKLRGAFTDALSFLDSGKSMLVIDEAQGVRPRFRTDSRLSWKLMLGEYADVRILSSVPIDLGSDSAPLAYCRRCSEPILEGWKGWPQKEPVPLLPILGHDGCGSCRSPLTDEIPADRIAWVNVHGEENTGLPDYWLLRAGHPDLEQPDGLIAHWGRPYLSEGPCPKCGNRAVLSELRAEGTKYNCEKCGVIDSRWR